VTSPSPSCSRQSKSSSKRLGVVFDFPNWVRRWHFGELVNELLNCTLNAAAVASDSFGWRVASVSLMQLVMDRSTRSIPEKMSPGPARGCWGVLERATLGRGTRVARAFKSSFYELDTPRMLQSTRFTPAIRPPASIRSPVSIRRWGIAWRRFAWFPIRSESQNSPRSSTRLSMSQEDVDADTSGFLVLERWLLKPPKLLLMQI
jgi:hypothetical protein